ncbi:hypothetical protein OAF85_00910 [Planctomycetota bacterium]|nr:hypothetical protein [Planctomycetota bacterium]
MKITLDLTSVVVGGAVALALGVVAGFSPQVTSVPAARPATPVTTMGANRPAARDIVMLETKNDGCSSASSPGFDSPLFTVPAGKILVITAIGATEVFGETLIPQSTRGYFFEIDGAPFRQELCWQNPTGSLNASYSFDLGIPLQEGQTVRVLRSSYSCDNSVRLHGYLEDA